MKNKTALIAAICVMFVSSPSWALDAREVFLNNLRELKGKTSLTNTHCSLLIQLSNWGEIFVTIRAPGHLRAMKYFKYPLYHWESIGKNAFTYNNRQSINVTFKFNPKDKKLVGFKLNDQDILCLLN